MDELRAIRKRNLATWAGCIVQNAARGTLTGKPFKAGAQIVNGPRAGAVLLSAGGAAGDLLQSLRKNDAALLRQTVPWHFEGEPAIFMESRYVRIEAGWPAGLAETKIPLASLGRGAGGQGAWTVGMNELGATVTMKLCDRTTNFLLCGTTGSGKSIAMRNAVLQLADGKNKTVLIDGKYREGLGAVDRLPGQVGPIATEMDAARAALGWACAEMRKRYEMLGNGTRLDDLVKNDGHVIVAIDEFQEFTTDSTIAGLMRKIAAQGRGARVHMILATQHPSLDVFADTSTRRNLTGRLALTVADRDASRVAVGDTIPRADRLLGGGDEYAIAPGACHRTQGAWVDGTDFDAADHCDPAMDEWPGYEPETVGQDLPSGGTDQEIALALLSAMANEGRPTFKKRFTDAGLVVPGSSKARRLMARGKAILSEISTSNEIGAFCATLGGG